MSRYIDRDEPLGEINRHKFDTDADYEFTWNALTSAETLDVAPVVHGRWESNKALVLGYCRCSRCFGCAETIEARAFYKYCPHCGAKMDEEDKDAT